MGTEHFRRIALARLHEEGVVRLAGRVAFGEVQRGEIVPVVFHVRAFGHGEAHVAEDRGNFLEHLHSQEEVADFLGKMYGHLRKGGRIAVMGPNFKYVYKQYFDFADHTVILSELGLAEHLYGAGFEVERIHPRFLPLSFRGGLPINRMLVRAYLGMPWAWRFFGKQFLLIGRK